jgi:hypothetical protein
MTFETDVKQWILEWVSVYNNNLQVVPCPFAKQALLDDKIIWNKAQSIDDIEKISNHILDKSVWKDKEVLIIGMDKNAVTPENLCSEIERINKDVLMPNGLVALEDHPLASEVVNGVKMNQGKWILILIQSTDKLNRASDILKKQGYYDNWSQLNIDEVVTWRKTD